MCYKILFTRIWASHLTQSFPQTQILRNIPWNIVGTKNCQLSNQYWTAFILWGLLGTEHCQQNKKKERMWNTGFTWQLHNSIWRTKFLRWIPVLSVTCFWKKSTSACLSTIHLPGTLKPNRGTFNLILFMFQGKGQMNTYWLAGIRGDPSAERAATLLRQEQSKTLTLSLNKWVISRWNGPNHTSHLSEWPSFQFKHNYITLSKLLLSWNPSLAASQKILDFFMFHDWMIIFSNVGCSSLCVMLQFCQF